MEEVEVLEEASDPAPTATETWRHMEIERSRVQAGWTCREAVNAWTRAIVCSAEEEQGNPGLLSYSDSLMLPQLLMHRDDEAYMAKAALAWHPQLRLDVVSKCLVPLHIDNVHWALLVMMPRHHLFCVYDSLDPPGRPALTHSMRSLLWMLVRFLRVYDEVTGSTGLLGRVPWVPLSCPFAVQQPDEASCAVHLAVAASLNCRCPVDIVRDVCIGADTSDATVLAAVRNLRVKLSTLCPEQTDSDGAWNELLADEDVSCSAQPITSPEISRLVSGLVRFEFRCLDPKTQTNHSLLFPELYTDYEEDEAAPSRRFKLLGSEVLLTHKQEPETQMRLELKGNLLAAAECYGVHDETSPEAGGDDLRAVYAQHAEAMARLYPYGPRTLYTHRRSAELCILSAALGDIFETLRCDEPESIQSPCVVAASGDIVSHKSDADLSLPWLVACAALQATHKAAPLLPRVDVALTGGKCYQVSSRVQSLYNVAGLACHVDPVVFSGKHKTAVHLRLRSADQRRQVKDKYEQHLFHDMLALDSMCCLRSCLDSETTRLLVLPEDEPWLCMPRRLQGQGYGAVLWVRDNGAVHSTALDAQTHMLNQPLVPLGSTRPHRHVCSMLRWGMSETRCLVSWNSGASSRQQGTPVVLLLQVHWVSKRHLWSFLLQTPADQLSHRKMSSFAYPPLDTAQFFPFCDLFELY